MKHIMLCKCNDGLSRGAYVVEPISISLFMLHCRIVNSVPQCLLDAYNSTFWKSSACDNVQAEILRQTAHIGVKINCDGNGKGEVLIVMV